jgi:hypothetical protein
MFACGSALALGAIIFLVIGGKRNKKAMRYVRYEKA